MISDDTFASTLTGIDELRSRHGSDDWPEWRRTVVDAVRAGAQLERRVQAFDLRLHGFAKAEAYTTLDRRVRVLELRQSSRSKTAKWGADLVKAMIGGLFVFALTRVFK